MVSEGLLILQIVRVGLRSTSFLLDSIYFTGPQVGIVREILFNLAILFLKGFRNKLKLAVVDSVVIGAAWICWLFPSYVTKCLELVLRVERLICSRCLSKLCWTVLQTSHQLLLACTWQLEWKLIGTYFKYAGNFESCRESKSSHPPKCLSNFLVYWLHIFHRSWSSWFPQI